MPPHEEIHKLNETSHGKIVAEELRTMWLKERWRYEEETTGHRTTTVDDYTPIKFAEMGLSYKAWIADGQDLIANQDHRWDIEKTELPELKTVDEGKGLYASIADTKLREIYNNLVDYFGDEKISPFSTAAWDLATNDKVTNGQWGSLLGRTAREVQRNANDLASVVANNRAIASDEVGPLRGGSLIDVGKWKTSELYKSLEKLERALVTWDLELRKDAFPDKSALGSSGERCEP
jgi:hypothetical protein